MLTNDFMFAFERLREGRGYHSQEKFVEGIVDVRQYRRYLQGESPIPLVVVDRLMERLKLEPRDIFRYTLRFVQEETDAVYDFNAKVMLRNFAEAKILLKPLQEKGVYDPNNRLLFEAALDFLRFREHQISEATMVERLRGLLNYPAILDYSVLKLEESVLLTRLMSFSSDDEKRTILNFLTSIVDKYQVKNYEQANLYLSTLLTLCKGHYQLKNFRETLRAVDRMIDYGVNHAFIGFIESAFYFKALAHFQLGQIDMRDESLYRLYGTLVMLGDGDRIKYYNQVAMEDLKINLTSWAQGYRKSSAKEPKRTTEKSS